MKTHVYMTRHGQTQWNKAKRMQGQMNSDLTPLGQDQARWLGQRLSGVALDVIISSSSPRAMATADLIRGDRSLEIVADDDLIEMGFGSWEGMLHEEVKAKDPEAYGQLWHHPHTYKAIDGESFEALSQRLSARLEDYLVKYEGKTILIVAHGIVLKSLIQYFEDKPLEEFWSGEFMASTCLNLLEVKGDKRTFIFQGDTSHYPKES